MGQGRETVLSSRASQGWKEPGVNLDDLMFIVPFGEGHSATMCSWVPREEELTNSINNSWFPVSSMESVEEAWSPSSPRPMVTQWGAIGLEGKCPQTRMEDDTAAPASTGEHQRIRRRSEETRGMWGIYSSTGQQCYTIPSIYDPKSIWRHESHPRSKSCKCPHRPLTSHCEEFGMQQRWWGTATGYVL